jgi:hypothetical protein
VRVRTAAIADFRYAFVLAVACFASACGANSPIAPSSVTISRPVVLSGQSNALFLEPFLSSIYPTAVLTVAESGRAIEGWSAGPSGNHWKELIPVLQQPIQAFVWWQGESDRQNPNYLSDLRDLIARVRQTNNNPQLLVIEVRVLDLATNASVRAAQETFVRTDTNAVLVSSDGFQLGTSDHLTTGGYRTVAQRVLDASRSSAVR